MRNYRFVWFLLAITLLLLPASAWAQNVGLTGRVTDETGGVLPGVTVEARSPALIEQVRTAVTDGEGLFTITDLRPGEYAVTFSLPGFQTLVRDGIELSGSVIATVNAELGVGAVEETITVTGDSPDVDIRNVVQETTLDHEVRSALPTGRNLVQMSELIPGITIQVSGSVHDVGGTELNRGASMIHGSRATDYTMQTDGMHNTIAGAGTQGQRNIDPLEVQEYQFETGGISAETASGGVRANMIPREGGNTFSGAFYTTYANESLQSDNTSQELIDLGLPEANAVTQVRDLNGSVGGPIMRDKLWFYASTRLEGAEKEVAGNYYMIDPLAYAWNPRLGAEGNADVSKPGIDDLNHQMWSTRFTWQASATNKLGIYLSNHSWQQNGLLLRGFNSHEAANNSDIPQARLAMIKWSAPVTNRLLLVAQIGDSFGNSVLNATRDGLGYNPDIIGFREATTGAFFRANTILGYGVINNYQPQARFNVSYVTGSHAAKVGIDYAWGYSTWINRTWNGEVRGNLFNGIPTSARVLNGPWTSRQTFRKLGIFAQDQWTLDRFTINAGIRFDGYIGSVPGDENVSGPSRWAPRQTWVDIDDVPNWKDISPRLGLAYDLFGDSRTALKFSANRYVVNEGARGLSASVNPLFFNQQSNRSWSDRNGDYIPQDDELGPLSNRNFATAVRNVTSDDAIREGWGVRQYNWEFSGGVQHQVTDGLSLDVAYIRRFYRNFNVNDLLDVGPGNYDEFCVTAPTDGRLGSVSGSEICGLYDINPAQFGLNETLITRDTNFGTQKESWEGLDATINWRVRNVSVAGGLSSGTQGNARNRCFVVDSPQDLYQCDVTPPWQNTFKFLGTVGLPYGIDLAGTYQVIPGQEILADWRVSNAAIASGIVRFVDPSRTRFNTGRAQVDLLQPGTNYADRFHQVDIRLSKSFEIGAEARAWVTLDIANLLNDNTIIDQNNTYGPVWLGPEELLFGRIFKPGVRIDW